MHPGRTTTVKAYHKGVEFAKHDRKRLYRYLGLDKLNELQNFANQILRVEVEIKSLKLRNDFGELPLVSEITQDYLSNIYEKEVFKLLRDSVEEAKVCRTAQAVEKRLYASYSSATAGALLGTWYRLATLGEQFVRNHLPKATFYRHRKQLLDVGVSWIETDVILKEYGKVPFGFTPSIRDSRRVADIADKVADEIKKVA
ncbi:phage/plasmid replication protein, II/X family [Desulfitobacterium sp. LBE]|uniref:phage/plasmid replication protein, II/X family n=1 Tax=Desulfitobacterium sp. LBE TaxID=884086 RepID=UPI00119F7257|nr:phage/plasmid replication protein, II/X family [Desulfitobacterium sp. LBE]